ncbi:MAG TPA: DinB family protein [Bacteroidota bacterium]|nr:DinB family protein [Bacteroidota bacterium]HTY01314.1 DinB family protein [Bacteroidota bacterium]
MIDVARSLKAKIDAVKPRLLAISNDAAGAKPVPDKWSYKEILGHLVDSASTNHQRIVRMQQIPDIGKFSYDQQRWVAVQQYASEPWPELVEFWYLFNAHLAHVIAHVDQGALQHTCDVGYAKPATLKFIIEDYLRHVEHHITQILEEQEPLERTKWVRRTP